jgi:hypothetical protein
MQEVRQPRQAPEIAFQIKLLVTLKALLGERQRAGWARLARNLDR